MLPHATCHMYATVGERWAARETHPTSGGAMYAATDSKGRLPICAAVIRNPEANPILSFHASHFEVILKLLAAYCKAICNKTLILFLCCCCCLQAANLCCKHILHFSEKSGSIQYACIHANQTVCRSDCSKEGVYCVSNIVPAECIV